MRIADEDVRGFLQRFLRRLGCAKYCAAVRGFYGLP